jgi:hypothetical protein
MTDRQQCATIRQNLPVLPTQLEDWQKTQGLFGKKELFFGKSIKAV